MTRAALAVFALSLLAAPPDVAADDLQTLLGLARRAAGWERLPEGAVVTLSGEATLLGVRGRFESNYGQDGRFRSAVEGGLTREVSYDGSAVLRRGVSGGLQELSLYARETELLRSWVHSGYWLSPAAPVAISLESPDQPTLGVRLRDGLTTVRVELDVGDYLPRLLRIPDGDAELRVELSRYREVGGVRIAHRVVSDLSVGRRLSVDVIQAAVLRDPGPSTFVPIPTPRDFDFDPAVDPRVDIVRASTGHMFVRALVNGEDLGLFLFDTGAGFSGISNMAAEKLGLEAFGETALSVGLGGGVRTASFRRPGTVQIGPLTIRDLVMVDGVDTERKQRIVDHEVAGVLGWDVLQRAVVELDAAADELRLRDPAKYRLPAGEWLPLVLHYEVPCVRARFEGDREGLFMVDSGAGDHSVIFFANATESLGLLDRREVSAGAMHGPAGGAAAHHGELAWIELGGLRIEAVPTVFLTGHGGETDPYSVGLIGGGILRRYRIVFDYSRQRVALAPR
jgi:Aspartyl protease